jgi:hypothetical protein
MRGVTIGSESDFAAGENVHELEGRVSARFPCSPDAKGSLASVDVARTGASGSIATVDARSTDETIKALFDCFHGINGFDQNPDLNHVAGFPVV